jgi:hypothetical protein
MCKSNWRVAHASVIGSSHLKNGVVCQDAGHCRIIGLDDSNEILLAIASDGAGSASKSEVGSQFVVDSFLDFFEEKIRSVHMQMIDRSMVLDWIKNLHIKIEEMALEENILPREFACTMLAAIVSRDEAIFFQIGDGAIVVAEENSSEYGYMFWPQHGEFVNQTNFLFHSNLEECLEFAVVNQRFKTVVLFTDGIERLVLDFSTKIVHAPAILPIVEWLGKRESSMDESSSNALIAYLSSDFINSRTDDDKTLVIATRATI